MRARCLRAAPLDMDGYEDQQDDEDVERAQPDQPPELVADAASQGPDQV